MYVGFTMSLPEILISAKFDEDTASGSATGGTGTRSAACGKLFLLGYGAAQPDISIIIS